MTFAEMSREAEDRRQAAKELNRKPARTFADLVKISQEHRLAEQRFEEAYRTRERLGIARQRALAEYAADLRLNANNVFIFTHAGKFFMLSCRGGSDWTLSPVEPIVIS